MGSCPEPGARFGLHLIAQVGVGYYGGLVRRRTCLLPTSREGIDHDLFSRPSAEGEGSFSHNGCSGTRGQVG